MMGNDNLEKNIIGTLLANPVEGVKRARSCGCESRFFAQDSFSLIYSALVELDDKGELETSSIDRVLKKARTVGNRPGERRKPSAISAEEAMEAIDASSGVLAVLDGDIRGLIDDFKRRQTERFLKNCLEDIKENPEGRAAALGKLRDGISDLERIQNQDGEPDEIRWGDLPDAMPEEDNPDVLVLGGFFRRGHGLFIVSTSGAGKSVLVNQLALNFAAGKEWLGLRPRRPLKVGVIQDEDDEVEMSDFRKNLKAGLMSEYGWTEEEFDGALSGVFLARKFVGKTGDAFIDELKKWQRKNKFDVIVLNPLFSYFGGNLSDGRDCTHFFREQLAPIMKSPDYGFGLVCVHHTTKPPKGDERKTWGQDAFAQYLGAGGTDVAGWSRASFLLLPISGHFGWFRLVATKRGRRLGWKDADGNLTVEKVLRYGDSAIYWRVPKFEDIPADISKALSIAAKPAEIGEDDARAKILAHIRAKGEIAKTPLWNWCLTQWKGLTSRKEVPAKRAYDSIVNNPGEYGLEEVVRGREHLLRRKNDLPGMQDAKPAEGVGDHVSSCVGDYDLDGDDLDGVEV